MIKSRYTTSTFTHIRPTACLTRQSISITPKLYGGGENRQDVPLGQYFFSPPALTCGSVHKLNAQSVYILPGNAIGIRLTRTSFELQCFSFKFSVLSFREGFQRGRRAIKSTHLPPASSNRTRHCGSSEIREARTQPAVPPPIMTTSYSGLVESESAEYESSRALLLTRTRCATDSGESIKCELPRRRTA